LETFSSAIHASASAARLSCRKNRSSLNAIAASNFRIAGLKFQISDRRGMNRREPVTSRS
jgi:hypothetical protein